MVLFASRRRDDQHRSRQFGLRLAFLLALLLAFSSIATAQLAETGDLLVADAGADAVFVVDLTTGNQSLLASGPPLSDPSGISVDPTTGLVYVTDRSGGPGGIGALIEIDPADGSMRVASSGDQLALPEDLIIKGSNGEIGVIDGLAGLVVIDPQTGIQTITSSQTGSAITRISFSSGFRSADAVVVDPGPLEIQRILNNGGTNLVGMADNFRLPTGITNRGTLGTFSIVSDAGNLSMGDGQIIELDIGRFSDPSMNQRVIASGIHLVDPLDLVTDLAGLFIYAVDPAAAAGTGAVIRVNILTGDQTILTSGDQFVNPVAIELFPLIRSDRVTLPLYVADDTGAEIIAVDPISGDQTSITSGGQLVEPSAVIAVPGSTDLFVTDRRSTDPGALIHVDAMTGVQTPVSTGGDLGNPEDLVRLENGDLLIADSFFPALIRIDPATGDQTAIAGAPSDLVGITVAADGHVYGLRALPPTLLRIDLAGGGTETVGSGVGLGSPVDLLAENAGTMIVLDATGNVIRIDPDTYDDLNPAANQEIITSGGELVSPTGIGISPDNTLYITDPGAAAGVGALLSLASTGGAAVIVSTGNLFIDPAAVASARALPAPGDLLVADALEDAIILIDPISGDQQLITRGGLLLAPDGIAFDQDGSLLVAEPNGNQLLRVDLETGFQSIVAAGPDLPDPRAVTVRNDGAIFVGSRTAPFPVVRVDGVTGDTVVIGSNLQNMPGGSTGETRFNGLQKLTTDPITGKLYVSTNVVGLNVSGDSLFGLDPDTLPLPNSPEPILDSTPLENGNEMVVDPATGDLFLANGPNILRIDPTDGASSVVSEGGIFNQTLGLAMEADGDLVTTSVFGDSVVRVDPDTGAQELVSYANLLKQPQGIAVVVPEPHLILGLLLGVGSLIGLTRRRLHCGRYEPPAG